jgi:hypothetical protein
MICPLWWWLMVLASWGDLAGRWGVVAGPSLDGAGASRLVLLD